MNKPHARDRHVVPPRDDGSAVIASVARQSIPVFASSTSLQQANQRCASPLVEKIKTGHYKSHLRNKQVATIFKELELIEKYGSGVRRVIDTFVAYGLREPEFEATQGGMAVTVFKATLESTKPESRPESQPESSLALDAKVLQLLVKAPMSKRDISAALGQKEVSGQLNKVVRSLVASGLIEVTIPDKKNSRLQQYRLTQAESGSA